MLQNNTIKDAVRNNTALTMDARGGSSSQAPQTGQISQVGQAAQAPQAGKAAQAAQAPQAPQGGKAQGGDT